MREPDWNPQHGQEYKEYIQTRDITLGVQSGIREMMVAIPRDIARIIGTRSEISERGYHSTVLDRSLADGLREFSDNAREHAEQMSRGLRRVSDDIQDLEDTVEAMGEQLDQTFRRSIGGLKKVVATGFHDLAVTFHWGVQELALRAEQQIALLGELRKGQIRRVREGAVEQWEMALTHMHVGEHKRAHNRLRRAIKEDDTNSRFYFHFGLLHLGSFENADSSIVKPVEAGRAFDEVVTYANAEGDKHAVAFGHFYAARAAYLQGPEEYPRAVEHLRQSIAAFPEVWEAWFQLGNILLLMDSMDEGLAHLQTAIEQDVTYALKAFELNGYVRHRQEVEELYRRLRTEWRHALILAFKQHGNEVCEWLLRFPKLRQVPLVASLLLLFERPVACTLVSLQEWQRKQDHRGREFTALHEGLTKLVSDANQAFEQVKPRFRYLPELRSHEVIVRWRQILQSSDAWSWLDLQHYMHSGFNEDQTALRRLLADHDTQMRAAVARIGDELVAIVTEWNRQLDEAVRRLGRAFCEVAELVQKTVDRFAAQRKRYERARAEFDELMQSTSAAYHRFHRISLEAGFMDASVFRSVQYDEWRRHLRCSFQRWFRVNDEGDLDELAEVQDEVRASLRDFVDIHRNLRARSVAAHEHCVKQSEHATEARGVEEMARRKVAAMRKSQLSDIGSAFTLTTMFIFCVVFLLWSFAGSKLLVWWLSGIAGAILGLVFYFWKAWAVGVFLAVMLWYDVPLRRSMTRLNRCRAEHDHAAVTAAEAERVVNAFHKQVEMLERIERLVKEK